MSTLSSTLLSGLALTVILYAPRSIVQRRYSGEYVISRFEKVLAVFMVLTSLFNLTTSNPIDYPMAVTTCVSIALFIAVIFWVGYWMMSVYDDDWKPKPLTIWLVSVDPALMFGLAGVNTQNWYLCGCAGVYFLVSTIAFLIRRKKRKKESEEKTTAVDESVSEKENPEMHPVTDSDATPDESENIDDHQSQSESQHQEEDPSVETSVDEIMDSDNGDDREIDQSEKDSVEN